MFRHSLTPDHRPELTGKSSCDRSRGRAPASFLRGHEIGVHRKNTPRKRSVPGGLQKEEASAIRIQANGGGEEDGQRVIRLEKLPATLWQAFEKRFPLSLTKLLAPVFFPHAAPLTI